MVIGSWRSRAAPARRRAWCPHAEGARGPPPPDRRRRPGRYEEGASPISRSASWRFAAHSETIPPRRASSRRTHGVAIPSSAHGARAPGADPCDDALRDLGHPAAGRGPSAL